MSPWLIQTCASGNEFRGRACQRQPAFLRILPRICASRCSPSKHWAIKRPLPSILTTWAYSAFLRSEGVSAAHGRPTLALLLEDELALLALVLVLAPPSVFAALAKEHNVNPTSSPTPAGHTFPLFCAAIPQLHAWV
jgi:hypothetical protein